MGLTATDNGGGGSFTPAPEGTHAARCIRVIDLGTQPGSQQYPAPKHKVLFVWELPNELEEYNGEQMPRLVSKRYTLSLNEKASLRHDLQSWRGRAFTADELKGFELKAVCGHACMVSVVHSADGQYANLTAVTAPPKGMAVPPAKHPIVYYEIEDGASDAFGAFGDKLQATIRRAPEWQGPADPDQRPGADSGDDSPFPGDDDIPF